MVIVYLFPTQVLQGIVSKASCIGVAEAVDSYEGPASLFKRFLVLPRRDQDYRRLVTFSRHFLAVARGHSLERYPVFRRGLKLSCCVDVAIQLRKRGWCPTLRQNMT